VPDHCRFTPGGLVSLFHVAGFINDSDGIWARVITDHDLLQTIPRAIFVPIVRCQKLLQVPWRDSGCQRDGLTTLLAQIRKLSLDVNRKVGTCVRPEKAIVKLIQITRQLGPQLANLIGIHDLSSLTEWKATRFAKLADLRNVNPAL
jgi:hypothetical protein